MGFYAKGSPDTVLHLTEKSDARGDITDDTIFHSSMPHVFIEKEWEVSLTNMEDKYTKVHPNMPSFASNNFFKDVRLANIPSDLSSEISSGSNIIITEVIYEVDGVEYSKIINGMSLSNSFVEDWWKENGSTIARKREPGKYVYKPGEFVWEPGKKPGEDGKLVWKDGEYVWEEGKLVLVTIPTWAYEKNLRLSSLYQPGLGLNIAYYGDSSGNPRSLADNNITNSYGLVSYVAFSQCFVQYPGKYNPLSYPSEFGLYSKHANKWVWERFYNGKDGKAGTIIKTKEVFPQNAMNGKQFNGVLVVPVSQRLGTPGYSNGSEGNINYKGKTIDHFIKGSDHDVLQEEHYISKMPLAQYPEGEWGYDKHAIGKNDIKSDYAQTKYYRDGITFKKIRWYKLNLTFSNNKYSLVNEYARKGEIIISRDKFMVNGLNINTSTKKMLYHINKKPKKRPGTKIFYANPSSNNTTQHNDKDTLYFPLCGCDVNGNINISNNKSSGVPLILDDHNYLTTTKFNGGGWFCTPNSIGDKDGEVWEEGAVPLKVMPDNITSTFSTISGEMDLKDSNTRNLISSIANLGLSRTRDTAIIFQVSTSDVFIHFPGTSYYRAEVGTTLNRDYKISVDSTTTNRTYSDHSIMILPIKKYVPIITLNLFMRSNLTLEKATYGRRSSTFIYWLYNRGDGGLDVYVSRNFKDWMDKGNNPPSLSSQERPIMLPKLDFTIAKLS